MPPKLTIDDAGVKELIGLVPKSWEGAAAPAAAVVVAAVLPLCPCRSAVAAASAAAASDVDACHCRCFATSCTTHPAPLAVPVHPLSLMTAAAVPLPAHWEHLPAVQVLAGSLSSWCLVSLSRAQAPPLSWWAKWSA